MLMSRRTTSSWRSSAFRTNSNPVDGSQLSSSSNWAEEVAHAAPNQLVIAYEQDTYSRHISSAKHLRPQKRYLSKSVNGFFCPFENLFNRMSTEISQHCPTRKSSEW